MSVWLTIAKDADLNPWLSFVSCLLVIKAMFLGIKLQMALG
ncbi:hypothetical protein N8Z80_01210 [Litorivicinus sp.]|nr:hypothetical protein [Litorivicinus sp.]